MGKYNPFSVLRIDRRLLAEPYLSVSHARKVAEAQCNMLTGSIFNNDKQFHQFFDAAAIIETSSDERLKGYLDEYIKPNFKEDSEEPDKDTPDYDSIIISLRNQLKQKQGELEQKEADLTRTIDDFREKQRTLDRTFKERERLIGEKNNLQRMINGHSDDFRKTENNIHAMSEKIEAGNLWMRYVLYGDDFLRRNLLLPFLRLKEVSSDHLIISCVDANRDSRLVRVNPETLEVYVTSDKDYINDKAVRDIFTIFDDKDIFIFGRVGWFNIISTWWKNVRTMRNCKRSINYSVGKYVGTANPEASIFPIEAGYSGDLLDIFKAISPRLAIGSLLLVENIDSHRRVDILPLGTITEVYNTSNGHPTSRYSRFLSVTNYI